jgi:serine/threonine-protein kinase HSL1 (negative regulator of Swe1 kinase)
VQLPRIHRLVYLHNSRANQEKYFYSALRKYHTDQLENYQPDAHYAVAKSNSDHHHNTRHPPTRKDIEKMPLKKHDRSPSTYWILNNEHLYSKHSFFESPVSEASYDPYRASRQLMMPEQGIINQNVTVYRGHSNTSGGRKLRPTTALGQHHTGSSLRVQALRNNSKRSSAMSRASSQRSTLSHRSVSIKRKSVSRSSLASSYWPSSPPVVARSGGLGRRGVSFSHLRDRRCSGATASTIEYSAMEYNSDENTPIHRPHTSIGSYGSSEYSSYYRSSAHQPSSALRSKSRGTPRGELLRLKSQKPDSPSKYIQTEARKVSSELGKVMEEAFNRPSIGSSIRTSGTEAHHDIPQYDTPPTSFSNTRDSGGSSIATPNVKAALSQRPLPPIPNETPNTFLQRKLAETRAEIARRQDENGDNTDHFTEVLENLDRLMLPVPNSKRTVSAPARSLEHPRPLHVILEEKHDHGDGFEQPSSPHYRAVTNPIRPHVERAMTEQQTIRVVDQSPTRVAPLNIRKRSGTSTNSKAANEESSGSWPGPVPNVAVRPYHEVQNDLLAARHVPQASILEKKATVIKKKKSLWFRRNPEDKDREQDSKEHQVKKKASAGLLHIPEAWQGLDDRLKNDIPQPTTNVSVHTTKQSELSNDSEFPIRHSNVPATKSDGALRKGFLGLFGKKSKEDKGKRSMELSGKMLCYKRGRKYADMTTAVNFSSSSILSGFDLGPEHGGGDAAPRTGPPEMQMNWLSRFLHIKPANKTLCFHIGRGKVRQDLVRLLRDWQRFGIRDVTFNRETNIINARVDRNNRKYISSSCSSLLFSEWRLEDGRFEVEVLEVKHILRCNVAVFLSHFITSLLIC